jgi:hypothetical protein
MSICYNLTTYELHRADQKLEGLSSQSFASVPGSPMHGWFVMVLGTVLAILATLRPTSCRIHGYPLTTKYEAYHAHNMIWGLYWGCSRLSHSGAVLN